MMYMDRLEDAKEMYAKEIVTTSTDPRKIELSLYFESEFFQMMKKFKYLLDLLPILI